MHRRWAGDGAGDGTGDGPGFRSGCEVRWLNPRSLDLTIQPDYQIVIVARNVDYQVRFSIFAALLIPGMDQPLQGCQTWIRKSHKHLIPTWLDFLLLGILQLETAIGLNLADCPEQPRFRTQDQRTAGQGIAIGKQNFTADPNPRFFLDGCVSITTAGQCCCQQQPYRTAKSKKSCQLKTPEMI